jgi:hypothetical protein
MLYLLCGACPINTQLLVCVVSRVYRVNAQTSQWAKYNFLHTRRVCCCSCSLLYGLLRMVRLTGITD